ncbi:hypothetical protein BG011_006043 [Mortierella polycephala]|uniref:Uncharacterized protein n=1 Tax=Mortierella polycephala TaxID=41804 RepID=A0A9P6PX42_9FUNG|nr:hypothetical protein BG011_006043 [Mortierella polycephala]
MISNQDALEAFALNPDSRPDLVQDFIPGTREYYIFNLRHLSLQLQDPSTPVTAAALNEAKKLLQDAEKSPLLNNDSALLEQLKNQFALLSYNIDPQWLHNTLDFKPTSITQLNNPSTVDSHKGTAATQGSSGDIMEILPTVLDQTMFKTDVLIERLLSQIKNDRHYTTVPNWALPHVLAHPEAESIVLTSINPDRLKTMFDQMEILVSPKSLEIIGKADTNRMDELIARIVLRLYEEKKLDFSDKLWRFAHLTNHQLETIRRKQPNVMQNEGFVGLLEKRIIPCMFVDSAQRQKGEVHGEWLNRMLEFVDSLPAKYNRHKLCVYLMSLEFDLAKGVMDHAKFMRYIAIPRKHPWYLAYMKSLEPHLQVDLNDQRALQHWSSRVTLLSQARDDEILTEYMDHFLRVEKTTKSFLPYFDEKTFLDPKLARVMLTYGDKDVEKWSQLLASHEDLAKLKEQTILKFALDNPETFLPSDPVVFKLKVKNAKRVLVRVFEVKTLEYLQQCNGPVGQALNLDGLTPNWEHSLTFDYPPLEIRDVTTSLPELAERRGAFIMDVISNGENSSAYFTKGYLDFIERQNVAGHVFTIIDEQQQKISEDVGIWYNGYYYKTNDDGDIVIPYHAARTNLKSYIYITYKDFSVRRSFTHRQETYNMDLSWHIDRESLIAGSAAKILLRPIVKIPHANVICPVDLLEQVSLEVNLYDTSDTEVTNTVLDFKVYDADWSEYTFQVPENFSAVEFTLSAKVKAISTGEFQDLFAQKRLSIRRNFVDQKVNVLVDSRTQEVQVHGEIFTALKKTIDGYQVHVLGKNGEKRQNIPLQFQFKHPMWPQTHDVYLRSDKDGIIDLGALVDIEEVVCGTTCCIWVLLDQGRTTYPRVIHGNVGEQVQVPVGRQDVSFVRSISLFKRSPGTGNDLCVTEDMTDHARLQDNLLTIKDLTAGYYILSIGESTKIDLIIASRPQVLDRAKHPLYLPLAIADDESQHVNIQVCNWTPATRVCIVATKFLPQKSAFESMAVMKLETPWMREREELTSTTFRTGRILGEEYQYVLNRKTQSKHWAGTLLTKPSVLLAPWSVGNTTMSKQAMAEQNLANVEARSTGFGSVASAFSANGKGLGKGGAIRHRKVSEAEESPLLSFMVHPSVVMPNLIPDQATGILRVPYSAFKESSFLQIFVTDESQALQQSLTLPGLAKADFQRRDLRFKSPLDTQKHYIGERTGIQLDPIMASARTEQVEQGGSETKEPHSITLASNGSSSSAVRVINSVAQIHDLMMTLLEGHVHKQNLRKFGFIVHWHRFSTSTKNEKYSKWNCHELNLFLYKKDREYFDAVVVPFIKNKLIKSFIDEYLIDVSLEKYTALREFSLLTCMEKCLLAQRIPRLRPTVAQWIRARVRNTKVASDVKLFRTIMKSGTLQELESADASNTPADSRAIKSEDEDSWDDDNDNDTFEVVQKLPTPQTAGCFKSSPTPAPLACSASLFGAAPGTSAFGSAAPPPPPPPPRAGEIPRGMFGSFGSAPPPAPSTQLSSHHDARKRSAQTVQKQFKPVDLTKEMAETYYWGRQDQAIELGRKDVNAFWLDLVEWDESLRGSFLSQNFVANASTFTEAMATIALMDVAFKPKNVSISRSMDRNLVVSSLSSAVVFHSSIKELQEPPVTGTVLVTQRYFSALDEYEFDAKHGTDVRKYIRPGAEFSPLESYGAHVVLMNATPNPMKVHVEVQLPQGSISIGNHLESEQDVTLSAHDTFEYEYQFYFPEEGSFPHYPVHVSDFENIIAFAEPTVLRVRTPEPGYAEDAVNTTSWKYVLTHGAQSQVLAKMRNDSLVGMDVRLLIPRLYNDKKFLRNVTKVLRERHEFYPGIWSVSLVLKNEDELVREYVASQSIANRVGDWFTSTLLTRRPKTRHGTGVTAFHYLEYFPLINARAHKATRNATILNDRFKGQYHRFMVFLSQKPKHDIDDLLVLIIYLLAQDRILEAKEKFVALSKLVKEAGLFNSAGDDNDPTNKANFQRIQYDYLRAYLSLCVEIQTDASADLTLDLEGVQKIVERYREYPVERWNKLFKEMGQYVNEIMKSSMENEADEDPLEDDIVDVAATLEDEVSFMDEDGDSKDGQVDEDVPVAVDFKIGSDSQILIRHKGVRKVVVEYYAIDAETMFSASPLTFTEKGESETNSVANNSDTAAGGASSSSNTVNDSYRLLKPNGVDMHIIKPAGSIAASTETRSQQQQAWLLKVPILEQYQNTNAMISVSTVPPAATRTWKAYYSQTISVQCQPRTGTIRVSAKSNGQHQNQSQGQGQVVRKNGSRPIRGGYVKVYAEMKQGHNNTIFWKDGYTDLVGWFAYAVVSTGAAPLSSSLSGGNDGGLEAVKRFVVFVDGGQEGCVVKTVPVPPV